MVKWRSFKFEPIEGVEPWVAFPSFGQVLGQEGDTVRDYRTVNIHLDPEKVYQMSLDQSTTNTGIFIKDLWNSEAHMIEMKRDRNGDSGEFIWNLENLLHDLCEGCNFSHIIYEEPIKGESFKSSRVLFQLDGMIKTLSRRYPEFSAARVDTIVNSSWREAVIDHKYDNFGRKDASMYSVVDLLPWTYDYGSSLYEDNDVFEAIGIMMGWFFKSFDPFGRPYVRGNKTTRPVGGFCLPGVHAKDVQEMLKSEGVESEFYVENPSYSICANLTASIRPHTTKCIEISNPYTMLCLCVECNIKWMNPEVMTLIVCDANTVDSKLKEIAGGAFHFVI